MANTKMRSSFKRRNERPSPREIKGEENSITKHAQPDNEDSKFSSPLQFFAPKKKRSRPSTSFIPRSASNLSRAGCVLAQGKRGLPLLKSRASFSNMVCDSSSTESEDEDYFINSQVKKQDPDYSPDLMDERITPHHKKHEASKSNNGRYGEAKIPSASTSSSRGKKIICQKKKEIIEISDDDEYYQDGNLIINTKSRSEKVVILEDLNIPTICVVDPQVVSRRPPVIWFQLVATSNIKKNHEYLPSLPPHYIQIKDVNMTVSFIKKYLVAKLGLKSTNELEINMQGNPVHPDTELWRLMKIWMDTAKRSQADPCATAGGSGEDFVMIFCYSWSSGIDPF